MTTSLTPDATREIFLRLQEANAAFASVYPGERATRQPVHTVYGGAHLFQAGSAQKLGALAIRSLEEYAPDARTFTELLELPPSLSDFIYARVLEKLRREPVEDFRIDFEDGYGNRSDQEEDRHAEACAREILKGIETRSLPPFIGIRIKPLSEEFRERAVRTLDVFLTALEGKLPEGFVVTLPKVVIPEQVAALADLLEILEQRGGFARGSLRIELMIETPQAILGSHGASTLPELAQAAKGRCVSAHFGTYDYTAGCGIAAAHQQHKHPACDFARHMMQVAFAGTGITLSDGATNVLPVAPHRDRSLTAEQIKENRTVVHHAWKLHFAHVWHSLAHGYYQGWDLHPAQLPTRFAAVYTFFRTALLPAAERLRNFVAQAARATLAGDIFDDAATGQGMLNFFLRGIGCGALTEQDALATGLALEELRLRSFAKILERRRG